jgi:transposase
MNKFYKAGIDIHKNFSEVFVIDTEGKKVRDVKVRHTKVPDEIRTSLTEALEGCDEVALEACYGWEWMGDLIEDMGLSVHLAHPYKTRLIAEAKVKTDKVDAEVLAQLLRTKFLSEAYRPPKQLREIRTIIRLRSRLVRFRTTLKNRIHSIIARLGIRMQESDIFGVTARKRLKKMELPGLYQKALETDMEILEHVEKKIQQIEGWMLKNLQVDEDVKLLLTIPGVGLISAHVILYEIAEIERFANPKKLISYAGLVPEVKQSGDRCHYGKLIKQANKNLKWIMMEIALPGGISYGPWRALYERVKKRHGANPAKIAVAREMLKAAYWVLKTKRRFKKRLRKRKKLLRTAR